MGKSSSSACRSWRGELEAKPAVTHPTPRPEHQFLSGSLGMDRVVFEIESLLPTDIARRLSPAHGTEVLALLHTYSRFKRNQTTARDLIFDSRAVSDRMWELLNVGKWIDAPVHVRQVYAIASLIQVIGVLHEKKEDALGMCLEITDLGILLGHPLQIGDSPSDTIQLTRVAEILAAHMPPANECRHGKVRRSRSPDGVPPSRKKVKPERRLDLVRPIETLSKPSLVTFYRDYFAEGVPVKLTDCIDHWPALDKWPDTDYIKAKAGHRTVPIEIGKHYADAEYRQQLMRISDFIDTFFADGAPDIGYLAQHQLFDQVPELRKDIVEPVYCVLSDREEGAAAPDVNAWFGPKGTVSPLHFDPKHNLLCQVVGAKKIVLYAESDGEYLYPRDGILGNTSRVDVENPDPVAFPKFAKATRRECLLNPGEILYIPPRYWHHVRALDDSFSVSFWWE